MIIVKESNNVTGYIEYRYDYNKGRFSFEETEIDPDIMYVSDTFSTLDEMLEKLKPETLEEIKKEYGADNVWISCISFKGKSKDKKTFANLSMYEDKNRGNISTEIQDDDITNRALLNIKKIKRIVDNTLNEYPIKY